MDPLMPPPVRRIVLDRKPSVAPPKPAPTGNGIASHTTSARLRTARPAAVDVRERMALEVGVVGLR